MQPYVLGIDIGTGSTKAVAVNYAGEAIFSSQFYYTTLQSKAGYSEQDPEVIWEAFVQCIREVVKWNNSSPAAIGLSSAMHGLMGVDENGRALQPLITWADTRSAAIAERLKDSGDAESIYKATGTPVHAMSPLCKLIWLKENNPDLFTRTYKFISIKEYIWFKLFGAYQIDYSIASATGLFNLENYDWDTDVLSIAGISPHRLSVAVDTIYQRTSIHTDTAALLGIPSQTPVIIGGSDGCLANVGSFALEPGIAALTIGTSGAVRLANNGPIPNFPAMTFNYILEKNKFICGGPVNNGGSVITWLLQQFLKQPGASVDDYEVLFEEVEKVAAGSDGLLFLPYLTGERAPVWDAKSCGVFFGIRQQHTQAHFLRAAIEGVCYALNEVLQLVEQSTQPVQQLNVSGGFIHSQTWVQLLADITGKKIALVQTEDASAIGAAYLTLKAKNIIEDYSSLYKKESVTVEPRLDKHQIHQSYFSIYKTLYASLRDAMHLHYTINK